MIDPHEPEPPRNLSGSNRMDIVLGIGAALSAWALGGFLSALSRGALAPLLFAAFVIGCVIPMFNPRSRVFAISMAVTGFGVPLAIFFALLGMCRIGG
ncbi:MAG TPA: hypothetical protein VK188_05610 [Holophaga sp.]|nr:hypothetical protein [Holophaga sp.]